MTGLAQLPGTRSVSGRDLLVIEGYLIAAVLLYAGLWTDLDSGYLVASGYDQTLFEWLFAAQAHALVHGENPLYSALQNAPLGVNLMANTAMPALAVALAPVTLALGPTPTWAIVLTGGLAGTAIGWYWLFSRHLVGRRAAAVVGGAFCGFAPPVISHAKAHPNFVAAFLLPVIAICLLRLPAARGPLLHGAVLGMLVALQVLIGEEILLIAVTVAAPVALGLAVIRRRFPRPVLVGLAAGGVVACALLAYPLWWQFWGPQSYRGLDHGATGNPLAAFVAYPGQSVAGLLSGASPHLALNGTEENAFFGWGLVVLVVGLAIWLRDDLAARLAASAAGVAAVLSLGSEITVGWGPTGWPGPWALLDGLPLFGSVLESRVALACVPAVGCLLALATQRVLEAPPHRGLGAGSPRAVWAGVLVAVLLPLVPVPFETAPRTPTPAFFTTGEWRRWAAPGRTIVPVPLPEPARAGALRWQVDAGMGFALPQGYFVGPWGPDRRGVYGTGERPTAALLDEVAESGRVPEITADERAGTVADLRYWRADVVVLAPGSHGRELHAVLSELLGPGRAVMDVWVWDVRTITR